MIKAEISEFGGKLQFKEYDLPKCPPDGAIVKVSYCGICRSDLTLLNPTDALKEILQLPLVLGHEIAGYLHELGGSDNTESEHLAIGDRVGVFALCQCGGICALCKAGKEPLCKYGNRAFGAFLDGGYASHVVVPNKRSLVKLPDNIPTQVGAVIGCAGITSYSAVCTVKENATQMLKVKGSSSLLIIGCGGLGQWAVVSAKAVLRPGVKIVVADINEENLRIGKDLGADDAVHWRSDMDEEALLIATRAKGTEEGGFDCVIDFVGNVQTMTRAMNLMHIGGTFVLIGFSDVNVNMNYPTDAFILRGYTVKGILYGALDDYKELIERLGKCQPKFPPTTLFSFKNATDALLLVKEGKVVGRAVLKITE